jgi:transposase
MPGRKTMRRIRECYRLFYETNLSQQQIAELLKIGRSTVWDYLAKLKDFGLSWDQVKELTDEALEQRLYSRPPSASDRPHPDCANIHLELRRSSMVTLQLLWEEYKKNQPNGYGYSRFCTMYKEWCKPLTVSMRQSHIGGEKLFVDYSGKRPHIRDRVTGVDTPVELFVMAWGASHYLYAEAQESQGLECWTMGHVRAFEYFGCVARLTVPDCLKSAVTKASLYDPDINRTYTDLANHYGFGVTPARPGKPKDKPKVENGVLIIQRWILAALRHRIFYSIDELNIAIRELLEVANNKLMQILKRSRRELFLELDKPNALPLPHERFEYHEWLKVSVNIDYHIEVYHHFYSVPYTYYGKSVSVLLKEKIVEIFYQSRRIAIHERDDRAYQFTTVNEHMPIPHQKHLEWTPQRLIIWGKNTGKNIGILIEKIIMTKVHPQQGFRPALGIMRLGKSFGNERLEKTAALALRYNLTRVAQLNEILKKGLDKKPLETQDPGTVLSKENIRGADYFKAPIIQTQIDFPQRSQIL